MQEERPVQIVMPARALPLPMADLRMLPEEDREATASRLMGKQARLPFDLERGPCCERSFFGWTTRSTSSSQSCITSRQTAGRSASSSASWRRTTGAFATGSPPSLPDLPFQYADYAVWQRRWLEEGLAQQLAYWTRRLDGAPASLDLTTDFPRPLEQSTRGASLPFVLPGALTAVLGELGRRRGATPFMVLLAGFQALLSRASGQPDVLVGTPVANRGRSELEPLIGCFVNTLVMRADLSADPSFQDLLADVRGTALEAYANQDVPFEKLVGEVRVERDLRPLPHVPG